MQQVKCPIIGQQSEAQTSAELKLRTQRLDHAVKPRRSIFAPLRPRYHASRAVTSETSIRSWLAATATYRRIVVELSEHQRWTRW
jgi:hypothetical protein